jgi:hypothetical protein
VTPWLQRYAVFVANCVFFVIVTGAWVTSSRAALADSAVAPATIHVTIGLTVALLTAGLAIWLMTSGLKWLGLIALLVVVAEGLLGERSTAISHADLAPVLFAITVVAPVCTSTAWKRGPDIVFDRGWPSLRSMAIITPVFVLIQAMLGAAFRHKAAGLTWHVVGAMVVALLILFLGMCVMQQFPKHAALRPAAIALLTIALTQVLLGIAAITTEMMAPDNTVPFSVMLSTAAHVAGGALTLAASLVVSIQIRRNVQKAVEEAEEGETPAQA